MNKIVSKSFFTKSRLKVEYAAKVRFYLALLFRKQNSILEIAKATLFQKKTFNNDFFVIFGLKII